MRRGDCVSIAQDDSLSHRKAEREAQEKVGLFGRSQDVRAPRRGAAESPAGRLSVRNVQGARTANRVLIPTGETHETGTGLRPQGRTGFFAGVAFSRYIAVAPRNFCDLPRPICCSFETSLGHPAWTQRSTQFPSLR